MLQHSMYKRIYYADTDAIGIVYHANYLRFCEMARMESLRSVGVELPLLLQEYGVQFAVFEIGLKYHKPARLDDLLLIESRVTTVARASVVYQQNIYLPDKSGDLLCEAKVKLVVVNKDMRPAPLPAVLKQEIMR